VSAGDRAAALTRIGQQAGRTLTEEGTLTGSVIGVGIDAVDVERFRGVIGRRTNMAGRLFTEGEQAYARAAIDPIPRMSTRFAAKEATMKALGVGLGAFPFVEVEVVRVGLGAPLLVLHGEAEELAGRRGVARWHLSLTHTDLVAVAIVVAEGGQGGGASAAGSPDRATKP
jgi:holo-[acyl-carrier protein] synthase